MTRRRPPRREAGLTMIEVMISVLLVSIAAGFVFAIQVRASASFRDQATVAEEQQTLRSAEDLITRDLRQAGYYANRLRTITSDPNDLYAVSVLNARTLLSNPSAAPSTDIVSLQYGDSSKLARVPTSSAWNAVDTVVDNVTGFSTGDLVIAVHLKTCTAPTTPAMCKTNWGCLMKLTNVNTGSLTLSHAALAGFNESANNQCANISDVWNDGTTVIVGAVLRSYRIKPNDDRGVLQMSPTGMMVANDWVDMAVGIIDLQAALRIWQPGDTVDEDGDGDFQRDWFSSTNMATALSLVPNSDLLNVSVTLVAKSTKNVNGATATKSPDVWVVSKSANNSIGDHSGTALPVSDPTSMYYGNFVYRTSTQIVDLRNVGIGN